ncbi:hypothetical protein Sa4125_30920 [Aureimonas sp. SA4125]|uniref:cupin domain-containing protein n=1 Tax=Aureimonas sp. SA4125 TaxID=2826993 RepID=UPI001CC60E12|nr:hypothetical protein [Aureimonas sp. SA4125]BDA85550.1 hypothetical protein Sa4125_30920 [Aureimonas sp. SA4125]
MTGRTSRQVFLQPDAAAGIPNNALPLLVAAGVLDPATPAASVHFLLRENGWQGTWTYTVYDFWHFHVTGFEVLVCIAGKASIGFGGDRGTAVTMEPGDAVIIPAGVAHRRLSGSPDFQVVGAYPPGQNGTIVRAGAMTVEAASRAIDALAVPDIDPLSGERPGRLSAWWPAR